MQNVIEFPHSASRLLPSAAADHVSAGATVVHAQAARSTGNLIGALSRTLGQIGMLCEMMPDGPIRAQLEAEQTRLLAGLFAARQSAAQLSSAGAATAASDTTDQPLALRY